MQTNQPTLPVSTSQSNETELTGDPEKDKKIKNLRKVCIKIFVCHNLSEDFHKRSEFEMLLFSSAVPNLRRVTFLCCRRFTLLFSQTVASQMFGRALNTPLKILRQRY